RRPADVVGLRSPPEDITRRADGDALQRRGADVQPEVEVRLRCPSHDQTLADLRRLTTASRTVHREAGAEATPCRPSVGTIAQTKEVSMADEPKPSDNVDDETTDQLVLQNPVTRYPAITPPKQDQPEPGLDAELEPKTDRGEHSYRG